MQQWLDRLTDLTALELDQEKLEGALEELTGKLGFSGYAYLNVQPSNIVAVSNYDKNWQSLYFKRSYATLDPVVKRAKSTKRIFTWSGEQEQHHLSKSERSFYAQAAEFKIRSGITIPVRTANGALSMFTLASEKPSLDCNRDIDAVAAATAVAQLHARISFIGATPSSESPGYLDPKGATYLKWIAVGKTMDEVADIESVKYNSVRVKIAEMKRRFEVHTMTHLIALAIRKKLI